MSPSQPISSGASRYHQKIIRAADIEPARFAGLSSFFTNKRPYPSASRVLFVLQPSDASNDLCGFGVHALRKPDSAILLAEVREAQKQDLKGLCLIENISPDLLLELGDAWDIDPGFFADYARNPDAKFLWEHKSWSNSSPSSSEPQHLQGVYEVHGPTVNETTLRGAQVNNCHRLFIKEQAWPLNVNTTLSYCNISKGDVPVYLMLVDASPLSESATSSRDTCHHERLSLRFPYSINRGGFNFLFNAATELSLYDTFEHIFCEHPWHLDFMMLRGPGTFPGVPFLYLITCSVLQSNLKLLEKSVHRIIYVDLAHPDWRITEKLHNARYQLAQIRSTIHEISRFIPSEVEDFFVAYQQRVANVVSYGPDYFRTPQQRLTTLKKQVDDLYQLTLESFDILIGTVAVTGNDESRKQTTESLKQTRQSILLTGLAIVYLPLSLATSIYGMNLQEMTGEGPRLWMFIVTTVALVSATAAVFVTVLMYHEQMLGYVRRLRRPRRP